MTDFVLPETMYYDPELPHLGGYHRGGDPLSYYPELWDWLIDHLGIKSVLDIGCGEGHSTRWFRNRGLEAQGIDGIAQPDPDIIQHDYTLGSYWSPRRFDLGWCCEFVEHVEERFSGNFLITFMACKTLLMTHAVPGQGGHHHVNCQDDDYWIRVVERIGFHYDVGLTQRTRLLAGSGYYGWSGLAFRRS